MSSNLFTIIIALSVALFAPQTGHADPGETRAQIIARYGKPDDVDASTTTYLDKSGLVSEPETILRFSSKDAPAMAVLNRDGKCTEEIYGWNEDIGQKRVLAILLRYSKGTPWRATKLDYPYTEVVWRYTQPESNFHAAYERRNTDDFNRVYYGLTIGL